jgi:hypothetical protein
MRRALIKARPVNITGLQQAVFTAPRANQERAHNPRLLCTGLREGATAFC